MAVTQIVKEQNSLAIGSSASLSKVEVYVRSRLDKVKRSDQLCDAQERIILGSVEGGALPSNAKLMRF